VRQHLIWQAITHAPQGYAKPFLSLSFNQRQQLQHAIRKLGQQTSDQLLAYTKTEGDTPQPSSPMELAQSQQNLEQVISNTLKTVSRETNHLASWYITQ